MCAQTTIGKNVANVSFLSTFVPTLFCRIMANGTLFQLILANTVESRASQAPSQQAVGLDLGHRVVGTANIKTRSIQWVKRGLEVIDEADDQDALGAFKNDSYDRRRMGNQSTLKKVPNLDWRL